MDHPTETTNENYTAGPVGIMDRLRVATAQQHEEAENHPFQQAFFAGRLSRDAYARYLVELHHVYSALEGQIQNASKEKPELARVVVDENYREGDLIDDLKFFGVTPDCHAPTPATETFVSHVEVLARTNPIALLGMHYVLEGSNNGSKFIARNIRRAYDLTDDGVRTLDPYGSDQRQKWLDYKMRMSALDLSQDDGDSIVEAAKYMFSALGHVSSDLMPEKLQNVGA
ncbi:MAG: heme oxygenase [Phycisphaerae bacterium]|nr:MAG: heme oxygenase [Phycisphaerae bacterium]